MATLFIPGQKPIQVRVPRSAGFTQHELASHVRGVPAMTALPADPNHVLVFNRFGNEREFPLNKAAALLTPVPCYGPVLAIPASEF